MSNRSDTDNAENPKPFHLGRLFGQRSANHAEAQQRFQDKVEKESGWERK